MPPTDASAALKAKEAKKSESPEKEQNLRAVVARKMHRPLRSREEEKAAARKKARDERVSKLSAAEQQKVLDREKKRMMRKTQGKVKMR